MTKRQVIHDAMKTEDIRAKILEYIDNEIQSWKADKEIIEASFNCHITSHDLTKLIHERNRVAKFLAQPKRKFTKSV